MEVQRAFQTPLCVKVPTSSSAMVCAPMSRPTSSSAEVVGKIAASSSSSDSPSCDDPCDAGEQCAQGVVGTSPILKILSQGFLSLYI